MAERMKDMSSAIRAVVELGCMAGARALAWLGWHSGAGRRCLAGRRRWRVHELEAACRRGCGGARSSGCGGAGRRGGTAVAHELGCDGVDSGLGQRKSPVL